MLHPELLPVTVDQSPTEYGRFVLDDRRAGNSATTVTLSVPENPGITALVQIVHRLNPAANGAFANHGTVRKDNVLQGPNATNDRTVRQGHSCRRQFISIERHRLCRLLGSNKDAEIAFPQNDSIISGLKKRPVSRAITKNRKNRICLFIRFPVETVAFIIQFIRLDHLRPRFGVFFINVVVAATRRFLHLALQKCFQAISTSSHCLLPPLYQDVFRLSLPE